MNTVDICTRLVQDYGCTLLSPVGPAPSDIDIHVPPVRLADVITLARQHGFVQTSEAEGQNVFRRFEGGQLFILDFMSGLSAYTSWQKSFSLTPEGEQLACASPTLHKSIKYLSMRRFDKLDHLKAHEAELRSFLTNLAHASWPGMPATGTAEQLLLAIKPNPLTPWRLRWRQVGKGFSMALVGPDGSGKGFYIEKLRAIGQTKVVYMGDWFFVFQKLYNRLMRIPSPYNRIVYLFYPVENFFRLLKVLLLRLSGKIVLIDRFPGTNRNVIHQGSLKRLNEITFKLFLKPDLIVLLDAPPEVVYARKQELSVDEISKMQTALRSLLKPTRHLIIDTREVDASLNRLLAEAAR